MRRAGGGIQQLLRLLRLLRHGGGGGADATAEGRGVDGLRLGAVDVDLLLEVLGLVIVFHRHHLALPHLQLRDLSAELLQRLDRGLELLGLVVVLVLDGLLLGGDERAHDLRRRRVEVHVERHVVRRARRRRHRLQLSEPAERLLELRVLLEGMQVLTERVDGHDADLTVDVERVDVVLVDHEPQELRPRVLARLGQVDVLQLARAVLAALVGVEAEVAEAAERGVLQRGRLERVGARADEQLDLLRDLGLVRQDLQRRELDQPVELDDDLLRVVAHAGGLPAARVGRVRVELARRVLLVLRAAVAHAEPQLARLARLRRRLRHGHRRAPRRLDAPRPSA